MLGKLKAKLYFLLAAYFRFWAGMRLRRWQPYIIVITASSGKTTLLHLLESQLGQRAKYSHLANSSYGIPFDILGLRRHSFKFSEWWGLFCDAPLALFKPLPKEKIYVVEADCDRPYEGQFLAHLLEPNQTLWLNVSRTHTSKFDSVVHAGSFSTVEKAVAHEFGYFIEHTKDKVLINGDAELIQEQLYRMKAQIEQFKEKEWLEDYQVTTVGTSFTIAGHVHTLLYLLPKETWYALAMCEAVCRHFNVEYDYHYKHFTLPPGRSSVFAGLRNTTLIDSSYNSNYDSMRVMMEMVTSIQASKLWLVLGDMIDLGTEEAEEHQKLGELLVKTRAEKILLVGNRLRKYTLPIIQTNAQSKVESFLKPSEALIYLEHNIQGGETILFKGSRFLEGIIEKLLANPADAKKLTRREPIWQQRRQKWGV